MSTLPAMPRIAAESISPVPPSTSLAAPIPDNMIYEVVGGQVVEKKMSARETEIASILVQLRSFIPIRPRCMFTPLRPRSTCSRSAKS
jgi:hypothetical protein